MHVSQLGLYSELRPGLHDVAFTALRDDVRKVVKRSRLAVQKHHAGTVPAPPFHVVRVGQHEHNAPRFRREDGRPRAPGQVHASVEACAVGALGKPRTATRDGRGTRRRRNATHPGHPADVRPQTTLTVHAHD